jgi:hypothetical protein
MTATIIALLLVVFVVGVALTCVCLVISWHLLRPSSSEDM